MKGGGVGEKDEGGEGEKDEGGGKEGGRRSEGGMRGEVEQHRAHFTMSKLADQPQSPYSFYRSSEWRCR